VENIRTETLFSSPFRFPKAVIKTYRDYFPMS